MALKMFRSKYLPVGVDLGTRCLKLAQLRMADQEALELIAADAVEVPLNIKDDHEKQMSFLSETISRSLHENHFHGRRCILGIPACHCFLQHVKLPRLSPAEIGRALQSELAGKLPYPIDQAVIAHVLAGESNGNEGRQEVIAVSVPRQIIDSYLTMAARAKLEIVGLDIESSAVVECFARLFRRGGDNNRAILFVDLGAQSTQVAITHGEKLVFARNLKQGEFQIDQALSAGLSLPLDQAHSARWDLQKSAVKETQAQDELYRYLEAPLDLLANEITQCLRYYDSVFVNQPVERVIFVGGQAFDKRLCQSLAERLNLPAQIGDPLLRVKRIAGAGLHIGLDRREPQPQWAVAVGLSLGAAYAA